MNHFLWVFGFFMMADLGMAAPQIGLFRGRQEFSQVLSNRILVAGEQIPIEKYLGSSRSLGDLMGVYKGALPPRKFIGGSPNAMNSLIYRVVISGIAESIASECGGGIEEKSIKLSLLPSFRSHVISLCQWPMTRPERERVLSQLFRGLVGHRVPDLERLAFLEFAETTQLGQNPVMAIQNLIQAVLLNPYLLLEN